jgi:N-dimethylarginine dimethylaminohydrolase
MFTRDACFCIGRLGFRSRCAFGIRKPETDLISQALPAAQWQDLPEDAIIEGGDVLVAEPYVVVGLGQRTNLAAVGALRKRLDPDEWRILTIELGETTLHLDTVLGFLRGTVVAERAGLAGPLPRDLCSAYDVIELPSSEAGKLASNFLAVDETTAIIAAGHEFLLGQLAKRGFNCIQLEAGEFLKLGGGFRCLTLPVSRGKPSAAQTRL